MPDHLVEIERKDLPNLLNLYTPDGYKSYVAYMTIENYIRWFAQDSNLKHVKVFCLNGDFSDGTFVVTDRCNAYADTFDESYDRLNRLLQLIDYSKGYTFVTVRPELQPTIRAVLQKLNVEIDLDDMAWLYYLPKEEAMKFDVRPPEDIELRPLTEFDDCKIINSVYSHQNSNSLAFFQRSIKFNQNIGAFKKNDGQLVAWILRIPTGLIGVLQTDEKHFGNGYGALVLRFVSKMIAESGHDIYAEIFDENKPSRSLFEKYGFQTTNEWHWIRTKITWSPEDEY